MDTHALQALGSDGIYYLSEAVRRAKVLLLTPTEDASVHSYLEAGAAGCVSKQADPDALARAIRAVVGGGGTAQDAVADAEDTKRESTLSRRENEVLQMIANGYTHSQIGRRLGISEHTVNTYVKRIRAKMCLGNKAELARAAVLRRYFPVQRTAGPLVGESQVG